jgi:hypothetical protein
MLARILDHALYSMLTMMRELFLILAVGILGSQLLIIVNRGPIGGKAQASTMAMGFIPVSSFEIDLDPGDPTTVRSVYVYLVGEGAARRESLHLSATPESLEAYPCHVYSDAAWQCPTPGLRTVEVQGFVVQD